MPHSSPTDSSASPSPDSAPDSASELDQVASPEVKPEVHSEARPAIQPEPQTDGKADGKSDGKQQPASPGPAASRPGQGKRRAGPGDVQRHRAQTSLKQAIARHSKLLQRPSSDPEAAQVQASVKHDLERLQVAMEKLESPVIRIAVFGLVSRGKSALINALVGQKLLQTGPLHGVTRWPRSVYWTPGGEGDLQVELIDTPGLEEVDGDVRASIAEEVAQQADLILFVISGDLTRSEYRALAQLRDCQKPLIVVFNKIDLYPEQDRQSIAQKLNSVLSGMEPGQRMPLALDEIVRVSAEPAPLQVRTEWPDGRVTYDWEAPPPQMDELRDRLIRLIQRDGTLLMTLNVLRESRQAEAAIAQKTMALYQEQADALIWKFAQWKAIAVAANPIAIFDLAGGAAADLVMIRSLARLYDLPMTGHEAGKLWRAIVWSSLSLTMGEVGGGLLLGFGKSGSAVLTAFDGVSGFAAYSAAAIAQASLAGYGAYRVGKAAQVYLEQGCTWGPKGSNTVIQDIMSQIDQQAIVARLRQEMEALTQPVR